MTRADYCLVQIPFSIFLGWISVATIANITILVSRYTKTLGWSASGWGVLLICVAGALGIAMIALKYDFLYCGVIAWALFAIADKQDDSRPVSITALLVGFICLIGSLATLVYVVVKNFQHHKRYSRFEI